MIQFDRVSRIELGVLGGVSLLSATYWSLPKDELILLLVSLFLLIKNVMVLSSNTKSSDVALSQTKLVGSFFGLYWALLLLAAAEYALTIFTNLSSAVVPQLLFAFKILFGTMALGLAAAPSLLARLIPSRQSAPKLAVDLSTEAQKQDYIAQFQSRTRTFMRQSAIAAVVWAVSLLALTAALGLQQLWSSEYPSVFRVLSVSASSLLLVTMIPLMTTIWTQFKLLNAVRKSAHVFDAFKNTTYQKTYLETVITAMCLVAYNVHYVTSFMGASLLYRNIVAGNTQVYVNVPGMDLTSPIFWAIYLANAALPLMIYFVMTEPHNPSKKTTANVQESVSTS